MRNYQLISHDVYFIADRIKEIDNGYFILFNLKKKVYEVHNVLQRGGTYCFTLPYNNLDERALAYTLKTRCQNIEKIIKEIDESNQKLEQNGLKTIKNKLEEVLL